ncbi:MAG: DEAD/DEAH box helicase, partial [Sphaerochaetaceae bacterium]|nr:DEAD/DEAH box helicase [Sphaerochaetaceae bacterium]
GGQTRKERKALFKKLEDGCKIVVTNPETLTTKSVKNELKKYRVSLFVVDEAHTIVQWGKSFRPAFSELGNISKELNAVQVLAFTATAGEETLKEIKRILNIEEAEGNSNVIEGDADRENIFYKVYPAYSRDEALLRLIKSLTEKEKPAIVFCRKRLETLLLCQTVHKNVRDVPVRYYHAGLSRTERENLEKWFLKSRDGILFATSAYGMGVDKSNIRTVIHYNLPSTAQEYLQESGRAGRDGKSSTAWVIVTEKEKREENKNDLLSVFTADMCRRQALLSALGQKKEECSGCDWCSANVIKKPELNKTALKMIRRRPLRFDPSVAASVLCAEKNAVMLERPGRTDSMWGMEKDMDQELIEQAFSEMPELSYIQEGPFKRLYCKDKKVAVICAYVLSVIEKIRSTLLLYKR